LVDLTKSQATISLSKINSYEMSFTRSHGQARQEKQYHVNNKLFFYITDSNINKTSCSSMEYLWKTGKLLYTNTQC